MTDYLIYKNKLFDEQVYVSKKITKYCKKEIDDMFYKKDNNIWDIQWLYALIKCRGLTITPQVNLVKNIGVFDNSTHKFLKDSFRDIEANSILLPLKHPDFIAANHIDKMHFANYRGKSISRILRIIKENGLINVLVYYYNVHFKPKFQRCIVE
jgi:hypothetical protein